MTVTVARIIDRWLDEAGAYADIFETVVVVQDQPDSSPDAPEGLPTP